MRTEKALPRPVWTKQGVAQLHYIAVETNLFRNILIRRHLLRLKSEQAYSLADGQSLDDARDFVGRAQMNVKAPVLVGFDDQVCSQVGFAGGVLTTVGLDLLNPARDRHNGRSDSATGYAGLVPHPFLAPSYRRQTQSCEDNDTYNATPVKHKPTLNIVFTVHSEPSPNRTLIPQYNMVHVTICLYYTTNRTPCKTADALSHTKHWAKLAQKSESDRITGLSCMPGSEMRNAGIGVALINRMYGPALSLLLVFRTRGGIRCEANLIHGNRLKAKRMSGRTWF